MVDRRLGRGLDFFLSGGRGSSPPGLGHAASIEETLQVELAMLNPNPNQPRRGMDEKELQDLANSIRTSGVLQPILARRTGNRYEIVAGERRWRAAKLAGLERIPVLVKAVTDEESAVFALVENLQREDLNAIEKANAFQQLQDRFRTSQEEVARRVGLDRSTVANFLRLLDLPKEVQDHVSRGTLSMGHARALLSLADSGMQVALADESIRQGLSVRDLESRVRVVTLGEGTGRVAGSMDKLKHGEKGRPVWLNELEENLVETLGTTVSIHHGRKKSRIVIECVGRDEFDRVYGRLKDC